MQAQRRARASTRRWRCGRRASCSRPGPSDPDRAGICLDLVAARRHGADPRRLPRPSGDRPGLRRQGRARAGADARQAHRHPSRRQRRLRGPAESASRRRATTRWSSSARACRPACASPPGPRTGWSWASRIASGRSTACSSIPRASPRKHGHALLKNFLALARGRERRGMTDVDRLQGPARRASPRASGSTRRMPPPPSTR